MSATKNRHEAERWIRTAEEDLAAAQALLDTGHFARACFLAQQCGEKAAKALWFLADADPWGHSIQRLVSEFPAADRFPRVSSWRIEAARLDRYYIPTRYPNGLPDLTGRDWIAAPSRWTASCACDLEPRALNLEPRISNLEP